MLLTNEPSLRSRTMFGLEQCLDWGHEYALNFQPAINPTCYYSLSTVWFYWSIGPHGVISNHLALW